MRKSNDFNIFNFLSYALYFVFIYPFAFDLFNKVNNKNAKLLIMKKQEVTYDVIL